jgi:hypothetical protein
VNEIEWRELKLKFLICPQQVRWPTPNVNFGFSDDKTTISGMQWEVLHNAVDELRSVVRKAWACIDEIEAERNLSAEAKRAKKARIVDQLIAELQNPSLSAAKEIIARQLAKWQEMIAASMRRAASDAIVDPKLWDGLKQLSGAARLVWLNKQASDLSTVYALLRAPQACSGLSDSEVAFVRKKAEANATPEIVKERDETLKALAEAEGGRRAAIEQIRKRASIVGPNRATQRIRERDNPIPRPMSAFGDNFEVKVP